MFQATTTGNDGFFSSLGKSLVSGVRDVITDVGGRAAEIIPIWTTRELRRQMGDTSAQPTFNPAVAANRLPDGIATTSAQTAQTGVTTDTAPTQKTGLFDPQFGGFRIDGSSIVLIALGGLALFYVVGRRGVR